MVVYRSNEWFSYDVGMSYLFPRTPGTLTALTLILGVCAMPAGAQTSGYTETVACENGKFGDLSVVEGSATLTSAATFSRVSDCGSKLTYAPTPVGECIIQRRQTATTATGVRITEPSPTTPSVSWLDAGPELVLRGPRGELALSRIISGASTNYSVQKPKPTVPYLAAGGYAVSFAGGRDIAAFEYGFDFQPLIISAPATGTTLSSLDPLTVVWTNGDSIGGELTVAFSVLNAEGNDFYDGSCRLANANDGSFTVPSSVWAKIPSTFRPAAIAVQLLSASLVATLPVPELEKGLRVIFVQGPVVLTRIAVTP